MSNYFYYDFQDTDDIAINIFYSKMTFIFCLLINGFFLLTEIYEMNYLKITTTVTKIFKKIIFLKIILVCDSCLLCKGVI